MALQFDEIGLKYQLQILTFNFSECWNEGSRPRFNEVGYFLRKTMLLQEGDVKSVGEHDSRRYFFMKICMEERADEVYESMREGWEFGNGFVGKAHAFKMNGQVKELNINNVQFEVEPCEVVEAVGKWGGD